MKDLELIVYPPLERPRHGEDIMAYRSQFIDERLLIQAKRLTDAELAAEYQNARLVSYVRHHRQHNNPTDAVLFDHYERGLEQEWFLERFATLPHYDEQP